MVKFYCISVASIKCINLVSVTGREDGVVRFNDASVF